MFKFFVLVPVLLIIPVQQGNAADLWEIYQVALRNDASYQSANLTHESNVLNLALAKTTLRPTLAASGRLGHNRIDGNGPATSGQNNQLGLDLTVPLYKKPDRINVSQSALAVDMSALHLENAKQDLILRVADRYFNLLASRDTREVARLEKVAIRRQMDLASERLEVGLGTRTDLFDAKARFQQAQADEIEAENQINNNIAALREIIDTTPEAIMPLSEDAPLELPMPNDVDHWVERALAYNIPLRIQAISQEIDRLEIEKQRQARSPTVNFDASHRWNDSDARNDSDTESITSIGLTVTYPIYQGGLIDLRSEQAGIQYNLAKELHEKEKRRIATTTISEFLAVNSTASQIKALSEAIVAGENALEAKEEGFSAGLTTNLDILDAQRDLSRSRTDYLRARYNYILSVLRLEQASGQLGEEDMQLVNSWLKTDS